MVYFENINLQARIERYLQRGFAQPEAEVLILIEETASALFSAFPERFVLVGGATLVLFYGSPRLSRDLDLLAKTDDLPPAEEIQKVVENSIQPLVEVLGMGKVECQRSDTSKDFIKIWVRSSTRPLFTVDLTRICGSVLKSEVVQETIAGEPGKTVLAASPNYLLLQKCETFLDRRYIKARDAFDINVLLSKGAALGEVLGAHLHDFIQMNELDADFVRSRIKSVDSKLCTVELRAVLPDDLFRALAKEDFKSLRDSLEAVFANWI